MTAATTVATVYDFVYGWVFSVEGGVVVGELMDTRGTPGWSQGCWDIN